MPGALEARRRRSEAAFYRLFDGVEVADGVWAAVTPDVPDRSLFNAVVYEDPDALLGCLDDVAALYASRGVRAWTVWVNTEDAHLALALEAAGHRLDGTPEAMGARLEDLDLTGHDIGGPVGWADAMAINEAAYGLPPGSMSSARELDLPLIGVAGQAVVGSLECDGDCWLGFVATHPNEQARGLCSALMKQTLRGAAERGCTTTTLEASPAGEPVYERLGYERLGPLEMWERRAARPPGESSSRRTAEDL